MYHRWSTPASGGGEDWEELDNFDTEDLWSEKAFVIVQRGEDPEAGRKAFVWIGEQVSSPL